MIRVLHDLRHGARNLSRAPGFTLAAVVALALGIGANTAIFSVVNAILLRPLPFDDPDRLVTIWEDYSPEGRSVVAVPEVAAYGEARAVFEGIAALHQVTFGVRGGGDPEQVRGALVSAELFPLLGVQAVIGRSFSPAEDSAGGARAVLLSHALWQRRFGGNPKILGRSLTLDVSAAYGPDLESAKGDQRYTVVGVLPPGFRVPFLDPGVELWAPLALDAKLMADDNHYLFALARLRRGVTAEQAQRTVREIAAGLETVRDGHRGRPARVDVVALREVVVGDVRPALLVLLGSVAFVLLAACANVANLQLSRGAARRREFAVRLALGARPRQLLAQLLAESLILAVLGGAVGFALGEWGVSLLRTLGPEELVGLADVSPDGRVLLFTMVIALATALLSGVAPATTAANPDPHETLQATGRSLGGDRRAGSLRATLVVAEIALAVLLLIGSGLLLKSFLRLREVEPGFDPRHALTFHIHLSEARHPESSDVATFYQELLRELEALPGVRAAGATSSLPMSGWNSAMPVLAIEGRQAAPGGEEPNANWRTASPGYFEAMGMPLLRGRDFTAAEALGEELRVTVVNSAMAREFWPGGDPLGRRIQLPVGPGEGERPWLTVVGVVGDVIDLGPSSAPPPMLYFPSLQRRETDLIVRTAGDPGLLAPAVREAVRRLDADQPIAEVGTLEERLRRATAPWRFNALAVGIFAVVSLMLAAIGIYGVVAFAVARRTREIGLRVALGARAADVLRMVLGAGARLTLWGVALGLLGALAVSRVLASLLYGVSATDLTVFGGVSLFLAGVALGASGLPALRAARLDPVAALREE